MYPFHLYVSPAGPLRSTGTQSDVSRLPRVVIAKGLTKGVFGEGRISLTDGYDFVVVPADARDGDVLCIMKGADSVCDQMESGLSLAEIAMYLHRFELMLPPH